MYGTLGFNMICVNLYSFPVLLQSGRLFKNNDAFHNNMNNGPKYNLKNMNTSELSYISSISEEHFDIWKLDSKRKLENNIFF